MPSSFVLYLLQNYLNFTFLKDYELRLYEKNKYAVIKYQMVDHSSINKKEDKAENDPIMKMVWRLMKYTQGENDQKICMKFLMPVFVQIENLESNEQEITEIGASEKMIEVKVFMSLPKEYQVDKNDLEKKPLDPPLPLESVIYFELMDTFKCYVRYLYFYQNLIFILQILYIVPYS